MEEGLIQLHTYSGIGRNVGAGNDFIWSSEVWFGAVRYGKVGCGNVRSYFCGTVWRGNVR